jgi:hypothetical protein
MNLLTSLSSLFGNHRRPARKVDRKARLTLESLEDRLNLSPILRGPVSLPKFALTYTAPSSDGINVITLNVDRGVAEVVNNGTMVAALPQALVSSVTITGGANTMNLIFVQQTPAGTTVNLGGTMDMVVIGSTSTPPGQIGTVTVNNYNGPGSLTVTDSSTAVTSLVTITGGANTSPTPGQVSLIATNMSGFLNVTGPGLNANSFTGNSTSFTLGGNGQTIVGKGFQQAYGGTDNPPSLGLPYDLHAVGDFWQAGRGAMILSGPVLGYYENAGGGGLAGLEYEAGGGLSPTYGMPLGQHTEFGNFGGSAQVTSFTNGAIVLPNNGAYGYNSNISMMSVLQEGNSLVFSWQCVSPVYAVLVGYSENHGGQQQTGRLPSSGSYTLSNVTAGNTYTFSLDTVSPAQAWLGSPTYSGWNFDLSYTAH